MIFLWNFLVSLGVLGFIITVLENILQEKTPLIDVIQDSIAVSMGVAINIHKYSIFCRVFIFIYIVAGIVLRTADQGLMYKALTFSFSDWSPKTLKDAMSGDFKILYADHFNATSNVLEGNYGFNIDKNSFFMTKFDLHNLIRMLVDLPQKVGIITDTFVMTMYYQHRKFYKHTNIDPPYILQSILKTLNKCFIFQKNSFLKESFDYYLGILNDAGLLNMWSIDLYKQSRDIAKFPEILEMKEFAKTSICFCVFLGLAFIIFCIEIFVATKKK